MFPNRQPILSLSYSKTEMESCSLYAPRKSDTARDNFNTIICKWKQMTQ